MPTTRKVRTVNRDRQLSLLDGPQAVTGHRKAENTQRVFVYPDPLPYLAVIDETLKRDIGLLCPQGKAVGQIKQSDKYYTKGCFCYDESSDGYWCPAGELLTVISRYRGIGVTTGLLGMSNTEPVPV